MAFSVDKALRQAQKYLTAGKLSQAKELYKQILSMFPQNKKAIQGYQKLKPEITSKSSSNLEPPQEQIQELITLYNQERFEAVLTKIKPMFDLFPHALELFNIQGAANAAQKNYDEAIDSYKQALKIKPNFSENHYNMGIVLHGKGDVGAALESYKRALKINPAHAKSHINLGIIYKNRGDFSTAIVSYKKALKIRLDDASVLNSMAIALKDQGEL